MRKLKKYYYGFVLQGESEWWAYIPDMDIKVYGKTRLEAYRKCLDALRSTVAYMKEHDMPLPETSDLLSVNARAYSDDGQDFSGAERTTWWY